jgi:hypothetical protein
VCGNAADGKTEEGLLTKEMILQKLEITEVHDYIFYNISIFSKKGNRRRLGWLKILTVRY